MAEAEFDLEATQIAFQQFETNRGNPRFAGDKSLYIKFYHQPVLDKTESLKEGRPIYRDKEYVDIIVPGDKGNIVTRPVRPMDRLRWPELYKSFHENAEQIQVGTPLAVWPGITRSQVEELKFFKVLTVEQLASMSDSVAQRFMGINSLRTRAQTFLEASKGMAQNDQFNDAMSKKDAQIAALNEAVKELSAAVASIKSTASEKALKSVDKKLVQAAVVAEPIDAHEDR